MLKIFFLVIVFSFFNATRGGNTFLATALKEKAIYKGFSYFIMALVLAFAIGNLYFFPFILCGLWLMMVVAGSKYFPHVMNTSLEPPSIRYVGIYIEKLADKLTSNYILHKTICLGLTKAITSIPLILMLSAYKLEALVLIPLMAIQGPAYLLGFTIADRIKKSELRGTLAEYINGAYIALVFGAVLIYS